MANPPSPRKNTNNGARAPRSGTAATARSVIDRAMAENQQWETVCLVLTLVFAATGLVVIGVGVWNGDGVMSLAGAVASALYWPAFRAASEQRRANIVIRMMELPLAHAETGKEAADAIRQMFLDHLKKREK